MEECPKCHFKKVTKQIVRDEETEELLEAASVCQQCGHILRSKDYGGNTK